MSTVGVLHTVPGLAPTFDDLIRAEAPGLRRVHVADAWLLDTARREGVTAAVQEAVVAHVRHLVAAGARAVLVTCSSIGEAAEAADAAVDVPVVRVDAAMAGEAVALATAPGARGRIAVLATLPSTLGPTGRLVERAVRHAEIEATGPAAEGSAAGPAAEGGAAGPEAGGSAGRRVEVTATVVEGAADAGDRGDRDRVEELVAAAVVEAAAGVDVIVLAQASMARAAARTDVAVPVLSSPAGGVAALLRAARP
jgi:aspartate/glutamate racemase